VMAPWTGGRILSRCSRLPRNDCKRQEDVRIVPRNDWVVSLLAVQFITRRHLRSWTMVPAAPPGGQMFRRGVAPFGLLKSRSHFRFL
jgi:hypothetical protein